MKEAQLINMKKRIEGLTALVKKLFQDVQANATLAQGTLTAFQLHLGEDEWNKLLEELKDKEKREIKQEKKLDLDVE
tara:strand:- start:94 stop:324 length:231 start_codon:yes stop_codon:yes gene_type:complete